MSYASRLESQSDRIRESIAAESTKLRDGKDYITYDCLYNIWKRHVGDVESEHEELDEFQECVPSPELQRKMFSAIKTISILMCIHWHRWDEFAERFCQATDKSTLDDLHDIDEELPFTREALGGLLFPDNPDYAEDFFIEQYTFLPLVLEENQKFKSYDSEYRLPLLDDSFDGRGGHSERIVSCEVAIGYFKFMRGGEFNSKV
jgi:hypothetical protein